MIQATDIDVELAQARSALYGLLGCCFQEPTGMTIELLSALNRWRGWVEVLSDRNVEIGTYLNTFRAFCLTERLDLSELAEQYFKLMGHAVRGTCPPYELEYNRGEIAQQASELADIAGFYQAFGLEVSSQSHERVDHVAAECEFMSLLCFKESLAAEAHHDDSLEIVVDAQGKFLSDHLAQWLPSYAKRLGESQVNGFYSQAGQMAKKWIGWECERLGIDCGPEFLELRPVDPQRDAQIDCGPEESCPGGQSNGENLVQLGIDSSLRSG